MKNPCIAIPCRGEIYATTGGQILAYLGGELAQHILQDTTILEIGSLSIRIDPRKKIDRFAATIGKGKSAFYRHAGSDTMAHSTQRDGFITAQPERLSAYTLGELQWQNAHAD